MSPGRRRPPPSVIARVVVGAAAAGLLLWGASGALPSARDGVVAAVNPDPSDVPHELAARLECIGSVLAEQVPPGAVVGVGDLGSTGDPIEWRQRLAELLFPIATVSDDPGNADVVVSLVATPSGRGRCGAMDVVITPGAGG